MQWQKIWNKIKNKFYTQRLLDVETENIINTEFQDIQEKENAKVLLKDLLSRNQDLLDTLDIKMLNKRMLDLFGQPLLERVVSDKNMQSEVLNMSDDELKTFEFILNYNTTDKKERLPNISGKYLKNIKYNDLKNLSETDKTKVISILLSDSEFHLSDLSQLNEYYEKRKSACKQIIDNPEIIEEIANYGYDAYWEKADNGEIDIPYTFIEEMQNLSAVERTRWAIIETKYGMSLEKAKKLCDVFGRNIDKIEQSEETRIIRELRQILKEDNIENLRNVDMNENFANYEGTLNIVSNLRNSYLHEYQQTLYQVRDKDYIGTQEGIKIYNALGKNNNQADFNMIVTSIGGIFGYSHDYSDFQKDWNRADSNHTISCSYIGNDFLGVADTRCILGFSDIQSNELLHSRNQDAGTGDLTFETLDNSIATSEFLIPKEQINTSKNYNELVVERKIDRNGKLVNRKPTYAVFMTENINNINDEKNRNWKMSKNIAKELGIPIVVIDISRCIELEWQKTQEMIKNIKEQKRMDLIPEVIHKFENNRGSANSEFQEITEKVFSNERIKKSLEEIIGTIITSDNDTFNRGIEEFVKVTKEEQEIHENKNLENNLIDCRTYNYEKYIERLKILFGSRNELFNKDKGIHEKIKERDIVENNKEEGYK